MKHFDIIIVGAGLVGLALARALKDVDKSIALMGAQFLVSPLSREPELRVSAINPYNENKLIALNAWQNLDNTRYCTYIDMNVWERDSAGRIQFNASDVHSEHLGTIVENQALVNALAHSVEQQNNVTVLAPAAVKSFSFGDKQHAIALEDGQLFTTELIVGADGAGSLVRRSANLPITFKDYGQTAIVATVALEHPHQNCARQVFTPHGPLALLPLNDPHLCSIVWSQSTAVAHSLMALSDTEFAKQLTVTSDACLGVLALKSERKTFKLTMQYARQWLKNGVVLCGDAAHTIHPLAGQGVNLGFDDAWHLANSIARALYARKNLNSMSTLREYERTRKTAAVKMIASMEGFHQLFTGTNPIKKHLRGTGLSLVNASSVLKQPLLADALGL